MRKKRKKEKEWAREIIEKERSDPQLV